MGPIWPRFMLKTGEDEGADEDGVVSLSSAGAGEVTYTFDTATYDHDGDMSGGDGCELLVMVMLLRLLQFPR